jgi:mercuric ion transport protein
MHDLEMMQKTQSAPQDGTRLVSPLVVGAAGTLALLSASCCVLPIGLSIVGLGGAWLGMLGPLVAHRPAILVGVGIVLAWALVRLIRRPPCRGRRAVPFLTFGAAALALAVAATAPLWEADAQRVMWTLWQESRS